MVTSPIQFFVETHLDFFVAVFAFAIVYAFLVSLDPEGKTIPSGIKLLISIAMAILSVYMSKAFVKQFVSYVLMLLILVFFFELLLKLLGFYAESETAKQAIEGIATHSAFVWMFVLILIAVFFISLGATTSSSETTTSSYMYKETPAEEYSKDVVIVEGDKDIIIKTGEEYEKEYYYYKSEELAESGSWITHPNALAIFFFFLGILIVLVMSTLSEMKMREGNSGN